MSPMLRKGWLFWLFFGLGVCFFVSADRALAQPADQPAVLGRGTGEGAASPQAAPSSAHQFTTVGGQILTDTTWTLAGSPYLMSSDVSVESGAVLTVEAGVEVRAEYYVGLIVRGALYAVGTPAAPITFTSAASTPTPGWWFGINILDTSDDARTRLEYATISYAGGYSYTCHGTGWEPQPAGINICAAAPTIVHTTFSQNQLSGLRVYNSELTLSQDIFEHNQGDGVTVVAGTLFLEDSVVRENEGNGVYLALSQGDTATLKNNTIASNTNSAVVVRTDIASGSLPTWQNNIVAGNGFNGLGVGGTLDISLTWPVSYVAPVAVAGDLEIISGGKLTVPPGEQMLFTQGSHLYVQGALWAVGTEAQPITFTTAAQTPAPGQWEGITFYDDSSSERSRMEYTTVSYGGYPMGGSYPPKAGIIIAGTSLQIIHTTVAFSASYGLYLYQGTLLASQDVFEHNGKDGINVNNGSLTLVDSTVQENGNSFSGDGLSASWDSMITLTNSIFRQNAWMGISVESSSLTMNDCQIEGNHYTGVRVSVNPGQAVILSGNTISSNSIGAALWGQAVTLNGNTIISNALAAAAADINWLPAWTNNTLAGNGFNGLAVGGTLAESLTWPPDYPVPLAVGDSLTINAGAELTVLPGKQMPFTGGALHVYGTLWAVGTVAQPITFTTAADIPAPGQWGPILIYPSDNGKPNRLEYVTVSYGAGISIGNAPVQLIHTTVSYSDRFGLYLTEGNLLLNQDVFEHNQWAGILVENSSLTLVDSVIQENSGGGLSVGGGAITLTDNLIGRNTGDGVYFAGSSLIASNNRIIDNTGLGINNLSTPTAQAAGNWWGSASGPYHAVTNPQGKGSPVSDRVSYTPWLTVPPGEGSRQPQTLSLGEPLIGSLESMSFSDYSLAVPTGIPLLVQVTPLNAAQKLWLFGGLGGLPTLAYQDMQALEPTYHGVYELLIPSTQAGVYYFSVFCKENIQQGGKFRIVAYSLAHYLSNFAPKSAGSGGPASIVISGLGLQAGLQVELQAAGLPTLSASASWLVDSASLAATFALQNAAAGKYDLVARWPGGGEERLAGAFTVTAGASAHLEASLDVPPRHRPNRPFTALVKYGNSGEAGLPAPLLFLSVAPTVKLQSACEADWVTRPVQVLGVNPGILVGSLPAGAQAQIPVDFQGEGQALTFGLNAWEADEAPVDWETQKGLLRPPGFSIPEWNDAWQLLKPRFGSSKASYLRLLGSNAQRLAQRGQTAYCISALLRLELETARGLPTAAIAGRALNATYGGSLPKTGIAALSQDGLTVRRTATDGTGNFVLEGLPAGVYRLVVEGYALEPSVYVTVTTNQDVTGLSLLAQEIPPEPPSAPSTVVYADGKILEVDGVPHLIYARDGQFYHAVYSGTAWTTATPIPGAVGSSPRLVYSPVLLDQAAPGLALFWQAAGEASRLEYAVARQNGSDWTWSQPQTYFSSTVPSYSADVLMAPGEAPLAAWLMADHQKPQEDSELYYRQAPIASAELNWTAMAGLLILDKAAALRSGVTLPPGSIVALGRDGQAYALDPASPSWSAAFAFTWQFHEQYDIPAYIPLIGGSNSVKFNASLEGEANDQDASISGSITGEAKFLKERATGAAAVQLAAKWQLNKDVCRYDFAEANLASTLNVTGKIPIWVYDVKLLSAEVGVKIEGDLSGTLIWNQESGAWPDGEIEGSMALGFYGTVMFAKLVEGEVSGTGNYVAILDKEGLRIKDIYFQAKASATFGWRSYAVEWRYPAESPFPSAAAGPTAALPALIQNTADVSVTLAFKTGTTGVYDSHTVLADAASDLVDDGPPLLTRSPNGAIYAFWTRESADVTQTLDSKIYYATFDGATWSSPTEVPGSAGFNRSLAAAWDASGALVLAWAHASAAGLTIQSNPEIVINADQNTDIWYARMAPEGWSDPAPLAVLDGEDQALSLGRLSDGSLLAAWLNGSDATPTLRTSAWDGTSWSTSLAAASGSILGPAEIAQLGGLATLVWPQDLGAVPDAQGIGARLYQSSYQNGAWSSPTPLGLSEQPALLVESALSAVQPAIQAPLQSIDERYASPGPALEALESGGVVPISVAAAPTRPEAPQDGSVSFTINVNPPATVCYTPTPTATPGPSPTPYPTLTPRITALSTPLRPVDPNEKNGPPGSGAQHLINPQKDLNYTIYFENQVTATAPAQTVMVVDRLDPNLDWSSLRFKEFAFGSQSLPVNNGDSSLVYLRQLIPDYRSNVNKQWWLEITAALDPEAGEVLWTFRTLDPDTGELPEDPLAGFLPPNDASGRGEGHITFSIRPKADVPVSARIANSASIIFDTNPAIPTNEVWNTTAVPPHADFSASPLSGPPPLEVAFTNLATGDYDTAAWDFGDGAASTLLNPTHVYSAPGVYTVTLQVSGLGGADTFSRPAYIIASAVPTTTPTPGPGSRRLYLPAVARSVVVVGER